MILVFFYNLGMGMRFIFVSVDLSFCIMDFLKPFIWSLPFFFVWNSSFATNYMDVSVHDPSVMRVDDTYYIVGSHMAGAKTKDFMRWTQLSTTVNDQNFFRNLNSQLGEVLSWAETETFWAGDWIRLADGRYYMYYCACKGDSPQSCIGYAVADSPEGPYENKGILLKSSRGQLSLTNSSNGQSFSYNSNLHPNAVDPNVFYDAEGKLWMVYGSYSGGIFILRMDPNTGKPVAGQDYYGKKLLGGFHCRIEAPYILYSPDTKYYYLFLSFGGLTADGGYNIRVCRSSAPDGPYYDAQGNAMTDCLGTSGKYLEAQDAKISAFGVKLMGNYRFGQVTGEVNGSAQGYVSPGHNSAYYDPNSKRYFLIFHSRFPGKGEQHSVRVHQMFMNEQGWPVVAPFRYGGEILCDFNGESEIVGDYKFVDHGTSVSADIVNSSVVSLRADGSISGDVSGSWESVDRKSLKIRLNGKEYSGFFIPQTDMNTGRQTMTFSVTGDRANNCLWGSRINRGSQQKEIVDGATYFIRNGHSGLFMDIPNGVNEDGTNLQQWEFNGSDAQRFRLRRNSAGLYTLASACSDFSQFVTVENASSADGANVMTSSAEEEGRFFSVLSNDDGTFRFLTSVSDNVRCVENFDFGTGNGSNVAQWEYGAREAQHWILTRASDPVEVTGLPLVDECAELFSAVSKTEDGFVVTLTEDSPQTHLSLFAMDGRCLADKRMDLSRGENYILLNGISDAPCLLRLEADGRVWTGVK